MSVNPAVVAQFKALKMGRLLDTLESRLDQARQGQLGYAMLSYGSSLRLRGTRC